MPHSCPPPPTCDTGAPSLCWIRKKADFPKHPRRCNLIPTDLWSPEKSPEDGVCCLTSLLLLQKSSSCRSWISVFWPEEELWWTLGLLVFQREWTETKGNQMTNPVIMSITKQPENRAQRPLRYRKRQPCPAEHHSELIALCPIDSPRDCVGEAGIHHPRFWSKEHRPWEDVCILHLTCTSSKASRRCTEELGTEPAEQQLSTFCYITNIFVLRKAKMMFPPTWLVSALIPGQAFTTTKYLFKARTFLNRHQSANSRGFEPFGFFYFLLILCVCVCVIRCPSMYTFNHTHTLCTHYVCVLQTFSTQRSL